MVSFCRGWREIQAETVSHLSMIRLVPCPIIGTAWFATKNEDGREREKDGIEKYRHVQYL